jgi:hypothetical protein
LGSEGKEMNTEKVVKTMMNTSRSLVDSSLNLKPLSRG